MGVSLTLVPALLFVCGRALLGYDRSIKAMCYKLPLCSSLRNQLDEPSADEEKAEDQLDGTMGKRGEHETDIEHYDGGWLRLGQWILVRRRSIMTLSVLFLLIIPFAIETSKFRSQPDWQTDIPIDSQSHRTLKAIGTKPRFFLFMFHSFNQSVVEHFQFFHIIDLLPLYVVLNLRRKL